MIAFAPDRQISLEFRRYARRFRQPLRTAHGEWATREGVVVRLATDNGRVGYGEAAPVPGFSRETVDEHVARLDLHQNGFSMQRMAEISQGQPSLGWALECALAQLVRQDSPPASTIAIAGLLPAGAAALEAIANETGTGRRVFKWKIGVASASEEISLADTLLSQLPRDAKLRLDANGGLGSSFGEWLDWCAVNRERIDYLEQPLAPGYEAAMLERGIAAGVPIALDESIAGIDQLIALSGQFPAAVLVVKPSLLGSLWRFLEWRQEHGDRRVVYSSCFETAVGFKAVWELAASDPRPEPAGLGVVDFLEHDGLCPVEFGAELSTTGFPTDVEAQTWSRL
ncbi:MAG: o-succinylbenzoate synthase [Puniceicoccales bacterium]